MELSFYRAYIEVNFFVVEFPDNLYITSGLIINYHYRQLSTVSFRERKLSWFSATYDLL